jgi:hypothetical protein
VALGELAVKAGAAALAGLRAAVAWTAEKIAMLASAAAEKLAAAAEWLLNFALNASPIMLIVLAIGLIVIAFVELWKHSAAFRDFWKGLWKDIQKGISFCWNWIKKNWPLLLGILAGPIGLAVALIVTHWRQIEAGAKWLYQKIVSWFSAAAHWLAGLPGRLRAELSGMWNFISSEAQQIYHDVVNWLDSMANYAAGIPGRIMSSLGSLGGKALSMLGFAAGGEVSAAAVGGPRGGRVLVGEHGPEIVRLPAGSSVHTNADSRRMLASGGGAQRVVLELRSSGNPVDDFLVQLLRRYVRVHGGDVQVALGVSR